MTRVLDLPRLAVAAMLVLGGCALNREPFDAPGTWQPLGANDHNLRAMVATPSHLERGVGAVTERGQPASLGATRLFTDRRRRLPVTTTSTLGGSSAGGGDPPVTGPGSGTGGSGAGR